MHIIFEPMAASRRWKVAQKAEIGWWKRYLKKKPVGDYIEWKRKYWTEFLSSVSDVIDVDQDHEILDAGCGPAGIFIILEGNKVTAIDPSA